MNERGTYGKIQLGADRYGAGGSSLGTWLLGGLVAGGALLWARHQAGQIEKLYATAGLPYEGFTGNLRTRAGELSGTVGKKLQALGHRLDARKGLKDGT